MTCYLNEESTSSLKDGIETLVVPIHDKLDMESLVFHTQRGGVYDVVEWLLTKLHRWSEMERVCGLSVRQQGNTAVVNLEMRQPGKQIEEWFLEGHRVGRYEERGSDILFSDSSYIREGPVLKLCGRALSQEKFSDKYKPWWEELREESIGSLNDKEEVRDGEHRTPLAEG